MSTPGALSVAAALWLGCMARLPAPLAIVALAALAVAVAVAARGRGTAALAVVLVAMVLLGGALAGGREQVRDSSPLKALAGHAAVRQVAGRVVTEPRRTPFGRWAIVRVTTVDSTRLAARALLYVRRGGPAQVGMGLTGRMRVADLPDGGFGAHVRGLGAVAALRPVGALRTDPAPLILRTTTVVRGRTRAAFDRALAPRQALLLAALVLGVRDGVATDELRAAGLSHLVVVSGRHVAVMLAGLLTVVAALGVGHRGTRRVALIGLWWFVALTRWQPSVLRAAVLATVALLAALSGRTRDSVHALAVTVLVLLLVDPMLARQAGFALSVLAAGGVLAAVRAGRGRPARAIVTAVRATLGAQLATAPIILSLAGGVPAGAVPANLIGAPAAAVAQAIGLVGAVVAVVAPAGAAAVARLASPPLVVLEWAATTFATVPALGARALSGAGALVVAAALLRRRWTPPAPASVVVGVVLTVAVSAAVVSGHRAPSVPTGLRLVVADVGQGDAMLVEAPDGAGGSRMVVDGGPDPGEVGAVLRARRIRAVDFVVLTHGDHDHAGGLAQLLERVHAATLLVPAGDPEMRDGAPSARAAIAAARAAGTAVIGVHAGQRFRLGVAQVEVVAPAPDVPVGAERNSRSIVLRVTAADGSMLLTGDVDEAAQRRLLERPDLLRADVLKVPHHGGATNADGFIEAVDPLLAVVSVGRDNPYGHPHPATMRDLAPAPVWRTDRDGTITVEFTADGPEISPSGPHGVRTQDAMAGV